VPSRRAFVAGSIALAGFAASAARRLPPPKIGAIHWPGPGYDLHGYMAIPAKAHGPQPAILVLPDGGADTFALGLTDALAVAGFVSCAPTTALSFEEVIATLHWLATNAYATGKVAAIGVGAGAGLVERVAAGGGPLSCGVLFDGGARDTTDLAHLLHLPPPATIDPARYAVAWREALDFLTVHLQPPRKR
jgi:dienelactone hydrolase